MTIIDAIEKSLKKGRGNEQAAAAQLAALLVVQLGSTEFVDEVCQCLIPTLLSIVGDGSMACTARAKVNTPVTLFINIRTSCGNEIVFLVCFIPVLLGFELTRVYR